MPFTNNGVVEQTLPSAFPCLFVFHSPSRLSNYSQVRSRDFMGFRLGSELDTANETDKQTDRQTNRQTDRQTDRQAHNGRQAQSQSQAKKRQETHPSIDNDKYEQQGYLGSVGCVVRCWLCGRFYSAEALWQEPKDAGRRTNKRCVIHYPFLRHHVVTTYREQ